MINTIFRWSACLSGWFLLLLNFQQPPTPNYHMNTIMACVCFAIYGAFRLDKEGRQ